LYCFCFVFYIEVALQLNWVVQILVNNCQHANMPICQHANMSSLVNVYVNDKEEKEDEESFLSQVCEKLCSSDCSSLVSKLFNMLHNESNYTSDVVSTVNNKTFYSSEMDNWYVVEWIWKRLYQWNKQKGNSHWYGGQTTIL